MCETDLERHGLALFSLLQKPIINSSPKWKDAGKDITAVAECIMAYKAYLEKQLAKQKANQQEIHPVRTIHKCATISGGSINRKLDCLACFGPSSDQSNLPSIAQSCRAIMKINTTRQPPS